MPFDANLRNTCIFLVIFIFAFFPNLFQFVLRPVLLPLELLSGTDISAPSSRPLTTCNCCPPVQCDQSKQPSQTATEAPASRATIEQPTTGTMSWFQKQFTLPSRSRGSYLITDHIEKELPELQQYKVGLLHLFVQHTSCALSLNENWDEEVRADMSDALDRLAPEDRKGTLYRHAAEGPDDMPAHIKSALIGASVSIPISDGRLNTGTWQGIWYLEFRASKHSRKVVATIQGEKK